MKITVSIPDPLFEAAEELARRKGMCRSELYARALKEHLDRNHPNRITQQLNRVCAEVDTSLDEFVRELQAHSIPPEEW